MWVHSEIGVISFIWWKIFPFEQLKAYTSIRGRKETWLPARRAEVQLQLRWPGTDSCSQLPLELLQLASSQQLWKKAELSKQNNTARDSSSLNSWDTHPRDDSPYNVSSNLRVFWSHLLATPQLKGHLYQKNCYSKVIKYWCFIRLIPKLSLASKWLQTSPTQRKFGDENLLTAQQPRLARGKSPHQTPTGRSEQPSCPCPALLPGLQRQGHLQAPACKRA